MLSFFRFVIFAFLLACSVLCLIRSVVLSVFLFVAIYFFASFVLCFFMFCFLDFAWSSFWIPGTGVYALRCSVVCILLIK